MLSRPTDWVARSGTVLDDFQQLHRARASVIERTGQHDPKLHG